MDDALYAEVTQMIMKHSPVRVNIPSRRAASLVSPIGLRFPVAVTPLRDLNNAICGYIVNNAGVLNIELLDGGAVGTSLVAGTVPDRTRMVALGGRLYLYSDLGQAFIAGDAFAANSVQTVQMLPLADATYAMGVTARRYTTGMFSFAVGMHDSNRFTAYWYSPASAPGLFAHGYSQGCNFDDESDFMVLDWAAAASTLGAKWISSVSAGGTAALVLGVRGGIAQFASIITTPTWLKGQGPYYMSGDGYSLYTRFAMSTIANCRYAVGFSDTPPAAAANSLWYTNDGLAIVQDDATGANYLFRAVRGGGVTDVDTGQACVAGEYHRFEMFTDPSTGEATLYMDGTLRATMTSGNAPIATTLLGKVLYADNIGAAVSAILYVDCFKPGAGRNLATTA